MTIEPDAPKYLLQGQDSRHTVKPIKVGIKLIDNLGVMDVFWYSGQIKRIARGQAPKPNESALRAFIRMVLRNGWGTMATKRLRAKS